MRTYSRKKPENELIADVHELCRLCLFKADEVVPIFSEDIDNVCATLALRIMICTGLEVSRDDCLPNFICKKCYDELNRYYTFRKRCEVTYQKLKSHLLAYKENQYKIKMEVESIQSNNNKQKNEEDIMNFMITFNQHNDSSDIEKVSKDAQENPNTEPPEPSESELTDISDVDLPTFVSTMLHQLDMLTQGDDGTVTMNSDVNNMEIETGDGRQIVMQLVEEDEQVETHGDTNPTPIVLATEFQATDQEVSPVKNMASKKIYKGDSNRDDVWCEECGKRMATRAVLARHKRVHSGEKPYECDRCGRRFSQKEILSRHKLVHEPAAARPFPCARCAKSFTQRAALSAHARAHEAPGARALLLHRCDRCPKMFLYASGLSRHMMMHEGRTFDCQHCGRKFNDKSAHLRHMRNHKDKQTHNNT